MMNQSPESHCCPETEDCESDEEVISLDSRRCLNDLTWAMKECEAYGPQLVTTVILRNTDINDRCSKPDLFDRYGKVRDDVSDTLAMFT